jgi:hypothetical protein
MFPPGRARLATCSQFSCKARETFRNFRGEAVHQNYVPAVYVTEIAQALLDGSEVNRFVLPVRTMPKHADARGFLLSTSEPRPCSRSRATYQCHELAPPHSITSSASVSRLPKSRRRIAFPKAQDCADYCSPRIGLQQGFATGETGFQGQLHGSNPELPMSALGQKRTSVSAMSASALCQQETNGGTAKLASAHGVRLVAGLNPWSRRP